MLKKKTNEQSKDNKCITIGIIIILFVTLLLLGIVYTYYSTRLLENNNDISLDVTSKKLEIVYKDGTAFFIPGSTGIAEKMDGTDKSGVEPGDSFIKEFEVINTGDQAVNYSIILDEMVNSFKRNKDWQYTLTQEIVKVARDELGLDTRNETILSTRTQISDDGSYIGIDNYQLLKDGINIGVLDTSDEVIVHKYVLKLTCIYSEEDQSGDMGAKLSFRVNILDDSI